MDPKSVHVDEKQAGLPLDLTSTTSNGGPRAGEVFSTESQLQRRLGNRQLQLIAVGGSIGTGLFVTIGSGLNNGGPASLFIAFVIYCLIMACVNNCIAEMATLMPVSGSFISMAGKWVDDALGFMVGWNFFLCNSSLIILILSLDLC